MKYKACRLCHKEWNISAKNKDENYICPTCEGKAKKPSILTTLLKNKIKFGGN